MKAFVLMPFAPEFDEVYDYLIRQPLIDSGMTVLRADDMGNQRNILHDIIDGINSCDLVVADLSASNPNVYYELGIAHAFGKRVILLTQDISEVPFDLRSYRVIPYSKHFGRMNEARNEMSELLMNTMRGTAKYGNPVSDYKSLSVGNTGASLEGEGRATTKQVDAGNAEQKGLLDYQVGLEDGMQEIVAIMQEVATRMNAMSSETSPATEILHRSDVPSKEKANVVRQLASGLATYCNWLMDGNHRYRRSLLQVEEGLNVMLSGQYGWQSESKEEIDQFVAVLLGVEQAAVESNSSFSELVTTLDSLPLIEREFDRAKKTLSEQLKILIGNIEQTISVMTRARYAASVMKGRT